MKPFKALIVDVFNIINYNIDISFNQKNKSKYIKALNKETYSYEENGIEYSGQTYRCRLNGSFKDIRYIKNKILTYRISSFINKNNGWVYVIPRGIDNRYGILYVSIIDVVSGENILSIIEPFKK